MDRESCHIGPPDWQYQCGDCGHRFEVPAPRGPAEEKCRTCPECGSRNISRVNMCEANPATPGG